MSSPKFNKTRLIHDLRVRYEMLQKLHAIDPNNGTAQLFPKNQAGKETFVNRCVAYGQWREIEILLSMIEGSSLGVGSVVEVTRIVAAGNKVTFNTALEKGD